ncbi:hypothetical protein CK936_21830 [Streptomyces albireticuli]|uniref:Uncharacterized protein n=1 Tax=Streptomyces albireticuli TaxID=1940 RepID=A0A2A2D5Y5_9ACTN|nr:hypothetical protein CK936_21830 [Streptomyces albireticuli]
MVLFQVPQVVSQDDELVDRGGVLLAEHQVLGVGGHPQAADGSGGEGHQPVTDRAVVASAHPGAQGGEQDIRACGARQVQSAQQFGA